MVLAAEDRFVPRTDLDYLRGSSPPSVADQRRAGQEYHQRIGISCSIRGE